MLTTAWNWRAVFWFLVIVAGTITISFALFFKDTFRRERSHAYQNVLRQRLREQAMKLSSSQRGPGFHKHFPETPEHDVEKQDPNAPIPVESLPDVKLSLRDVSLVKPLVLVLRRINNIVILTASGAL